jgi:Retroviral aspartyl protease
VESAKEYAKLMLVRVLINKNVGVCLVDSGATHSFVSLNFLMKHKLLTFNKWKSMQKQDVKFANGTVGKASMRKFKIPLQFKTAKCTVKAYVIEMHKEYQVILGINWLTEKLAIIDFGRRKMMLKLNQEETIIANNIQN